MAQLSDVEIGVFRWAAHHGHLSAEAAALALDLPPESVRQAASTLVARHLLRPLPGAAGTSEGRLVPVAPEAAAATLLAPLETALREQLAHTERLRGEYSVLAPLYSESRPSRHSQAATVEVRDLKTVIGLIDDAMARCTEEILTCEPRRGRPADMVEHAYTRDLGLLQRGVRMRTLYQHTARHDTSLQENVERLVAAGAEVRTLSELFGRMIAVDRETVFIPHWDEQDGAAVIRDPSTVGYLCQVFDQAWILATPYRPTHFGNPTITSDAKLAIVRLLTEGMKDEVIARRLGMSLRTCRKHIAEIMESFRAESRFQLGYLIRARLGAPGTTGADLDHVVDAVCGSRGLKGRGERKAAVRERAASEADRGGGGGAPPALSQA
ncbi:LuxR C-terminal-related transcriptional regulator [Streptomyces varsoviensis]|uniref:LuxR C-terminal-related transcriptional regulator n=1 Tax=Streptomyces varsoviensis TaxID=67373 RepID=UPI0006629803|nr:LuxR C-terminal-related transcriptional regulator [Streptomyces varsoviensis]